MQLRVATLLVFSLSIPVSAQFSFKKVELRTSFASAEQGNKGQLIVNRERIRFVKKDRTEYFAIPADAVTEIFYSRVAGRRIKTAILISPLLLFSKGKKHYMTLSFDDKDKNVGAIEFKLHKSNYRGVLRTVEEVTDLELLYDQEGVKASEETVAGRSRSGSDSTRATVEISSSPPGAEIEIDGSFVGSSPRSKALAPGEYKIKLTQKGYKDWERKIAVEAGEALKIVADMDAK